MKSVSREACYVTGTGLRRAELSSVISPSLSLPLSLPPPLPEEIPSEEDEVKESRNAMQEAPSTPSGQGDEDDDDDDDDDEDYWDEEGLDGTPLEEYSTPLDYDNGEDEYQFFTAALLGTTPLPRCRNQSPQLLPNPPLPTLALTVKGAVYSTAISTHEFKISSRARCENEKITKSPKVD